MLMLMLIDAGAQAQACAEGGHQGDVREGGEGGGEARVEGGEGLAREGSQGLDLSQEQLFSVAIKDRLGSNGNERCKWILASK